MKDHWSKYFGEIHYKQSEDNLFEGELKFKTEQILLEFELEQQLEQEEIDLIDNFLDNFESNYLKINEELKSRLFQTGYVRDYLLIIEDEFNKELRNLLKGTDSSLNQKERLFSQLYVCRIEFFHEDDRFAVLDITIDEGITNDLLVIGIDKFNNITYTTIES